MKKSTIKFVIIALMLLVVALYYIAGTYARYTDTKSADAVVKAAAWAVALKDSEGTEITTQDIDFAVQSNTNVMEGRIAPAVTAVATVKLDLTGTEVRTEYTASIDNTALSTVFGDSASNVSVSINGVTSGTYQEATGFATSTGYTGTTAVQTLTITLTWDNNNDAQSASDTLVGKKTEANRTITLPVTLTARQVISGS